MKFSLAVLTLVSTALAAYVPSEPWSTLTPDAAAHSCANTDYQTTFGIAISTVTETIAKRELATQVGDGQVQHTTGTETVPLPTKVPTTTQDTTVTEKKTKTITNPPVIVTQIGDGQIQAPNPTPSVTDVPIHITKDGKPSVSISYSSITSHSSYSYRPQTTKSHSSAAPSECPVGPVADSATCKNEGDLSIVLKNGVLYDSKNRIGSIVSNRQFQFDGPVPQAGAIYAAGWSIQDGKLALGGSTTFYECLSGTFYNLYDQSVAEQCTEVVLSIVDLVDC